MPTPLDNVPSWAAELAQLEPSDSCLPSGFPGLNVTLNRLRLAEFLVQFASDCDLRDLLLIDLLGVAADAHITSTGIVEDGPGLAARPFRVWEYAWLFKGLDLAGGNKDVLDLGGPASHLTILSALASNRVISLDVNPLIVAAARRCRDRLNLEDLEVRRGDMRDLSGFADASFDRIVSCSVLEHLTAADQTRALSEMARVLRPGGVIGLTFDYGKPAPGANAHLPPPHEPPPTADEMIARYVQCGLVIAGNAEIEAPIDGALFRDEVVEYTVASLFLAKPPFAEPVKPVPVQRSQSFLSHLASPTLAQHVLQHAVLSGRVMNNYVHTILALREENTVLRKAADERLEVLNRVHDEAQRRGELIAELKSAIESRDRRIKELQGPRKRWKIL